MSDRAVNTPLKGLFSRTIIPKEEKILKKCPLRSVFRMHYISLCFAQYLFHKNHWQMKSRIIKPINFAW